ncbi:hypothetical protein E2562_004726 [Oryza meyeriana var. granulata]|uniref:Uncharacterized protein n=1 Tax=Oryza meyeriana var. granulata TaxID=110450 RepID=A0A6G1DE62_9ORYZ|nr:hypothetical protein E2562_004726 [Oryza meyeriana var. granulata]
MELQSTVGLSKKFGARELLELGSSQAQLKFGLTRIRTGLELISKLAGPIEPSSSYSIEARNFH